MQRYAARAFASLDISHFAFRLSYTNLKGAAYILAKSPEIV